MSTASFDALFSLPVVSLIGAARVVVVVTVVAGGDLSATAKSVFGFVIFGGSSEYVESFGALIF